MHHIYLTYELDRFDTTLIKGIELWKFNMSLTESPLIHPTEVAAKNIFF